jgi:stage II sporulation protein E
MIEILAALENNQNITQEALYEAFEGDPCSNPEKLISAFTSTYEIYKVDMVWKKRFAESRGIVSQQLKGVSKVISNLASDINKNINFKEDLEGALAIELDKAGFPVDQISVIESSEGKIEVTITNSSCYGTKRCEKDIATIISNVAGQRMMRKGYLCSQANQKSKCVQRFTTARNFSLNTGVASGIKYKGTVSGDNYTFMELCDGKYVMGLSDGMGSGEAAKYNSKTAINLLEKLLSSGFDKDTAIKLINSVLVLDNPNESFATMDISIIDLQTGIAEFIKVGGETTFIKKKDKIEYIKNISLPVGILDNIEFELQSKNMEVGDLIIMATDGILDSIGDMTKKEKWLNDLLIQSNETNPQELANYILNAATENCKGNPSDDMTVIVSKIIW